MTSGFLLPIPDHPSWMFTSHPSILLFVTQFLYESSKSSTDVFSLSDSFMLVLCSAQLGGTETEADTLTHCLCPPHYDNPHGLHSTATVGERDREGEMWKI